MGDLEKGGCVACEWAVGTAENGADDVTGVRSDTEGV